MTLLHQELFLPARGMGRAVAPNYLATLHVVLGGVDKGGTISPELKKISCNQTNF